MIIQEHFNTWRCITQHDHGRISGILAQHWRDPSDGSTASPTLICATYLHDILWTPLDLLPRWDARTGHPLDFIAFPSAAKCEGYAYGIDAVAALDPYIGLLHARHFSGFVPRDKHPLFRAEMDARIAAWNAEISPDQAKCADKDLALLRLFDVFSLLLCMTGPQLTRDPPPWLAPSPLLQRRGLRAEWSDADTVIFEPWCFDAPLDLHIPYREIPHQWDSSAAFLAFGRARCARQRVHIRPAR